MANSQKIKIVFVLGPLDLGGTERQFLETVRKLDRSRFQLSVFACKSQGNVRKELEVLQIPFTSFELSAPRGRWHPQSWINFIQFLWKIIGYFRQEQPHIMQSYLMWMNILGGFTAKITGIPIIITGRRAIVNEKYMPLPRIDQWLQDLSNLTATIVVANSKVVRDDCLQREHYLAPQKIRVIHNGVDTNRFRSSINKFQKKRELQLPEDSQVIGIVATLHPRKGHHIFLEAAQKVLRTFPKTSWLIVGRDDGIRSELETFAKDLKIWEAVFFAGERHDISEILAIIDIQVSASYIEGLSNALLEGMAAGNPIVATDIGGNQELVVPEQTGLLVPAGDPEKLAQAILRLLCDKSLRERMGQAVQIRVNAFFSIEHTIKNLEALYEELAQEHGIL